MSPDSLASNPIGWKLAGLAFVVLAAAIFALRKLDPKQPVIKGLGKDYFSTDKAFLYGPTKLFGMLAKYDKSVYFEAHKRFIKYDLVFALVYTAAAIIIIIYFYGALAPHVPEWFRHLWLLPLIGGVADILEGLSMWGILNAYESGTPERAPETLALFSSAMTTVKIVFLCATAVLLFLGLVTLAGKKAGLLFRR